MSHHILIVEDRDSLRRLMARALAQDGYEVTAAPDAEEAIRQLARRPFELVLTDLKLPGQSGLAVVRASRAAQPPVAVVVLSAFGTVPTAVEAMKEGACDFLEKPIELDDLSELVRSLLHDESPGGVLEVPGARPILGRHPRMRAALRLLRKVAATDSTVLLTGETGTGKELFARAVHAFSPRSAAPFVAVNCAAIPASLMENELFGHEKGAFTGARGQKGRFEQAEKGTIFLDEIGELDLALQGKTLRVIEERTLDRLGGRREVRLDVRLVAATHRDLREMAGRGEFRQDLLFRLDVFPIELPALRDRASDIGDLARFLLTGTAAKLGLPPPDLTEDAVGYLEAQPWPGNVRQLANVLERAMILHERGPLTSTDLRAFTAPAMPRDERSEIREALVQAEGDKLQAAERLGISLRTMQRKVRDYDLEGVPRYRS